MNYFCNLFNPGTNTTSMTCGKVTGECVCKANVEGRSCNQCTTNSFNLTDSNAAGCEPCHCDPTGTQGGTEDNAEDLSCHQNTGQCACLTDRFGIRCDDCVPGKNNNLVSCIIMCLCVIRYSFI